MRGDSVAPAAAERTVELDAGRASLQSMEFPAWDPVLLDIPGAIDIRWYGLMYVVGFVVGQLILVRLARARFWPVSVQQAPDLIVWLVLGVMLGGRLGFALFYDPDHELILPWNFIKVWKGGLSFHGGLAGVVVASWLFTRKHKLPWPRVADVCALAVTPGIFAVRCANFVNGELYGRITQAGVGWAMRFPTDPVAERLMHLSPDWSMRDRELCIQVAYHHRTWDSIQSGLSPVDERGALLKEPVDDHMLEVSRRYWETKVRPFLDWDAVKDHVPFRHPSQLYEGIGEGLVVGLVLFALYWFTRRRPLRRGWYAAVFLLGYAVVRFSLEFVREPDAPLQATHPNGYLFGMTMGQMLSTGMVVGAVLILLLSRQRDPPAAPLAVPGEGHPEANV